MSELIPVVAIVGPTAVRKSALALRLAKSLDGEIISADSRQVYRFMDIGTAKPSIDERADVKHHLIDIVDPDGDYSLARFIEEASKAIQNVNTRSNLPLVVGGTGQYAWGLLEGWKAPKVLPNPELRQILAKKMAADGLSSLYDELVRRDPEAAKKIDARNPRRVIRALEVVYSAPGLAASEPRSIPPLYDVKIIGLTFERSALYRRIDDRVDAMIKSGWIDEVRGLLDRGYATDLPSMSSLGYRELVQYLRGELSLDEALNRIKYSTHRFARRQYTWFKPTDDRIQWFEASDGLEIPEEAVKQWLKACGSL